MFKFSISDDFASWELSLVKKVSVAAKITKKNSYLNKYLEGMLEELF